MLFFGEMIKKNQIYYSMNIYLMRQDGVVDVGDRVTDGLTLLV